MKTSIKSIATIAFLLGILGTPALASGGRGTSGDIKLNSRMKMSKSYGTGEVKDHAKRAVINFSQPNR